MRDVGISTSISAAAHRLKNLILVYLSTYLFTCR